MNDDFINWPAVEGRYAVGRKTSPVAVCTNASIDEIEINPQKAALWGKCVTENIGLEKIIQNIVSNPNIRYLVLCGRDSKGHFVSQAVESLLKNGVDKNKMIIGAKGNMPFLKGISEELIERFRKQITAINMVGEKDAQKIERVIDGLLLLGAESFSGDALKIDRAREVEAKREAEWVPDPNGFFVVSVSSEGNPGRIIVEHYQGNKSKNKIVGKSAQSLCKTIAKMDLIGEFSQSREHAMYLARELQKAEIALKNNLGYEQDGELIIKSNMNAEGGKVQKIKHNPADEYGWHD